MILLVAMLTAGVAFGSPATPVAVGAAGTFAVLAGVNSTASVTSTPDVTVFGNMGSGSAPVLPNFVCGDLYTQTPPPTSTALTNAYADATLVRGQLNTPPQPTPIVLTSDLGGITLTPGVYSFGTTAGMAAATTLTFDALGDPDALFIIQVGTSLDITGNANMVLANGARACNVYWRVGTSATIAGTVHFVGTISAGTSITVAALATVDGRLWANDDITLAANVTVQVPCALATTKTPDAASASVGQVITYTVTITNNSPCGPMSITSVVDTRAGDVTADFPASVPASDSVSGQYTYTVQAGDPNPVENLVTVLATYTGGAPSATLPFTSTAAASVALVEASFTISKSADTTVATPGDTINYTITLTNTGRVALDSLSVTDSLLGPLAGFGTSLASGATVTNTFPYVVQASDPNPLPNTVTATALPEGGTTPISTTASASVAIVHPGLEMTKTADLTTAHPGDVITYTITLSNTGDVTLDSITVSDPLLGGPLTGFPSSLGAGASVSSTFPYTVQPTDLSSLVNTARPLRSTPRLRPQCAEPTPLVNTAYVQATVRGDAEKEVTASASVTVAISPTPLFTMTVAVTPTGSGTVTGAGAYTPGSVATLAATPNPGYRFKYWWGAASGSTNPVQITMDGNKTVTAAFVARVVLTVTANPPQGGTATGSGTYDVGTSVTVKATPAAGWKFASWTGPVANAAAASTTVTLSGDATVTANFVQAYILTVTASPTLGGTVTGAGTFVGGSTVPVTAKATAGWQFVNWTGPVADPTAASTTVTVNSTTTVTATFVRTYTLTLNASPTLGGTVTGAGTYVSGSVATLTATPNPGYRFKAWWGAASGSTNPVQITMDGNKTVTATFVARGVLTVTANPTQGGTVTGSGTYDVGTAVAVKATPAAGWKFTSWTGPVANATAASTTFTLSGDATVTANFVQAYILTVTASPTLGGTVTGGGTFVVGATVPVTAKAAAGWQFVNWTGPVADPTTPSTTVTMNSSATVTANFVRLYTMTVLVTPTGGGTVTGGGTYVAGSVATLTATPNPGYRFKSWWGAVSGSTNPVQITMNGNKTATATFVQLLP